MGDKVSMKISLVEKSRTREMLVYLSSSVLNSFASKEKLLTFILNDVFEEPRTVDEAFTNRCRIERKSKRHKKFVPLEYADDFKELLRSLRVKKHLKLVVYLKDDLAVPSENPLTEAIDQIKKISSELQKSELWELLKSLTLKIDSGGSDLNATVPNASINSPAQDKVLHHHILCDSCHPHDDGEEILGTRYKCMDCENFDLCEKCYLSKTSIFKHLPSHVMLAVPNPVNNDNFRFLSSRKLKNDKCVDSTTTGSKVTANSTGNTSSLPHITPSQDFDKILGQSIIFEELLSLIPDEEDDKLEVIRGLIEAKYRDMDVEKDELSFVFISNEGKDYLMMSNKSSMVLPQGKFLLKFQKEDNLEHLFELEATSDINPGAVTSFEAEFLDSSVFNGANVSFVHSNGTIALEGKCSPLRSSGRDVKHVDALVILSKERSKTENIDDVDLGITVVPKGKLLSQIVITNRGKYSFNTGNLVIKIVNCFQSVVALVTVGSKHAIAPGRIAKFNIPINNTHFKFPFRVVVESANFSLSCGLSLKHLSGVLTLDKEQAVPHDQDNLPKEISILSTHEAQPIHPDNTPKEINAIELDVPRNSSDATESDDIMEEGEVIRQEGDNNQNTTEDANVLIALEGAAKSIDSLMLDSALNVSEEPSLPEIHQNSLILPSMPLKVLNLNFDTSGEKVHSGDLLEREDYDVISIGDASEVPSDFEVLSCTNSYEN